MVAAVDGAGARSLVALSGELRFTLKQQTPAWPPDGRTILVPAWRGVFHCTVVAVDAGTGATSEVRGEWLWLGSVQWMPDGKSFVIHGRTNSDNTAQLWQVAYPSGERRRITNAVNGYQGVSLAGDGRVLATVQYTLQGTTRVVPAGGGEGTALAFRSGRDAGGGGLAWTPDGHHLVFTAQAAGRWQVWIAPADGGEARQLTRYETALPFPGSPVVSPDGRDIYYCLYGEENARICRMGIDGSDQGVLTTGPIETVPLVSPDNQWVYFSSVAVAKGRCTAMKMKVDGSQVSPLSKADFMGWSVSPDGTELLGVLRSDDRKRAELAVLPVRGGAPRLLGETFSSERDLRDPSFTPDGALVTYTAQRNGRWNVYGRPRLRHHLEPRGPRRLDRHPRVVSRRAEPQWPEPAWKRGVGPASEVGRGVALPIGQPRRLEPASPPPTGRPSAIGAIDATIRPAT